MRLTQPLHLPAQTAPAADEALRRDWAETNLAGGSTHTILSTTHTDTDTTKAPVGGDVFKFVGGLWVPGRVAWGEVQSKPATFPPDTHGHANATTTADGFMASGDKGKLDGIEAGALNRVDTPLGVPAFSSYSVTSAGGTWIRLSPSAGIFAPRIDIPVLGPPPPGKAWYVDLSGTIRVTPDVACDAYIGAGLGTTFALDGSTMVGGSARGSSGHQFIPVAASYKIPDPTVANTITFTSMTFPGSTRTVQISPLPTAKTYLGPA